MERAPSSIVKLNVGGVRYMTTLATLASRGPNFLTTMIENDQAGRVPSTKDEKGCYFIDRNGRSFEPILDYLRTGQLSIPPYLDRASVLCEMDFYLIHPEIDEPQIDPKDDLGAELRSLCRTPASLTETQYTVVNKIWPLLAANLRPAAMRGLHEGSVTTLTSTLKPNPAGWNFATIASEKFTEQEKKVFFSPLVLAYIERKYRIALYCRDVKVYGQNELRLILNWGQDVGTLPALRSPGGPIMTVVADQLHRP